MFLLTQEESLILNEAIGYLQGKADAHTLWKGTEALYYPFIASSNLPL